MLSSGATGAFPLRFGGEVETDAMERRDALFVADLLHGESVGSHRRARGLRCFRQPNGWGPARFVIRSHWPRVSSYLARAGRVRARSSCTGSLVVTGRRDRAARESVVARGSHREGLPPGTSTRMMPVLTVHAEGDGLRRRASECGPSWLS